MINEKLEIIHLQKLFIAFPTGWCQENHGDDEDNGDNDAEDGVWFYY